MTRRAVDLSALAARLAPVAVDVADLLADLERFWPDLATTARARGVIDEAAVDAVIAGLESGAVDA